MLITRFRRETRLLRVYVSITVILACGLLGGCGAIRMRVELLPRFVLPSNDLAMRKLDNPVELYHDVSLSHLPVGWKVSSERKDEKTELKIHTTDWGVFEFRSIDNRNDELMKEDIKIDIRFLCEDRWFTTSYSEFRKRYPSEKIMMAEYSRFEPGVMFEDSEWVNKSQQEELVVAAHCLRAFAGRVAARVPHESLDVFVGSNIGLGERLDMVMVTAFRKDSSEGIFILIRPVKTHKPMLAKDAGKVPRVSAALIDGLTCGKTK